MDLVQQSKPSGEDASQNFSEGSFAACVTSEASGESVSEKHGAASAGRCLTFEAPDEEATEKFTVQGSELVVYKSTAQASMDGKQVTIESAAETVTHKANVKGELVQAMAFRGAEVSLRRGVALAEVMRGGGRLFRGSQGSTATYALSEEVSALGFFISHNWVVPRWKKFLALAFHFNFTYAALFAVVYTVAIAALQALGHIPFTAGKKMEPVGTGILCVLTSTPAFFLAVFFLRDFAALFGWRGPMVFLDKCCINQVDQQKMAAGISKLGAFISASDKVMVLYTDIYLVKLWTVYEIAAFLSVHPHTNIVVLPVAEWSFLCLCFLLLYLTQMVSKVVEMLTGYYHAFHTFMLLCTIGYALMARKWKRQKLAMLESLKDFRVQDCTCFVESDRLLVYSNIRTLMVALGSVSESADLEECLDVFNVKARSLLDVAMAPVLRSRVCFKQRHYHTFGFILVGGIGLDKLGAFATGLLGPREVLLQFLNVLFWMLVGWPMSIALTELIFVRHLGLQRLRELCFVVACMIPFASAAFGCNSLILRLRNEAFESDIALAMMLLMVFGGLLFQLTIWRSFIFKLPKADEAGGGGGLRLLRPSTWGNSHTLGPSSSWARGRAAEVRAEASAGAERSTSDVLPWSDEGDGLSAELERAVA